jgi:large subunit ribosomal protein L28
MAQVCDICGRGVLVGFSISHAHNKTKKRQKPNLRTVHLVHSGTSKMTVRVCADDLKELKRKNLIVAWKDKPENQKAAKAEAPAAPVDTTPKKLTPKQKKALEAKKEAETVEKTEIV